MERERLCTHGPERHVHYRDSEHGQHLDLAGNVTFLVGLIIYRHLPLSALWVVGLLLGVELLMNGWTLVMLGIGARRLIPPPTTV